MTYMLFFTLLKRTTVHKVVYQRPHPPCRALLQSLVFMSSKGFWFNDISVLMYLKIRQHAWNPEVH